jgi:hypothetical protein
VHDTPVAPRPASGFAQQARPLRDLGWQREDGCTTQECRIFHGILRLGVIHLRKNRYQDGPRRCMLKKASTPGY